MRHLAASERCEIARTAASIMKPDTDVVDKRDKGEPPPYNSTSADKADPVFNKVLVTGDATVSEHIVMAARALMRDADIP